jgi:hydrogenase maturation protease
VTGPSDPEASGGVLVVGLGNELRGDDAAGIEVARRLPQSRALPGILVHEHQGDPAELLELWRGRDAAVVVDCMRSGAPAGTIRRFDVGQQPLPGQRRGSTSSHAIALTDAIEIGRELQRLPRQALVYAVEGRDFEAGSALSPPVEMALVRLADAVWREALRLGVFHNPVGVDPRCSQIARWKY